MRITRRRFWRRLASSLTAVVGCTVALTTGQLLLNRTTARSLYRWRWRPGGPGNAPGIIRPPGAVEEGSFLAGCIRCYRCQDVCEAGAIQLFTEAPGRHLHTPYVDPARAACNLCMKCTQVCPTGVLQPLAPRDRSRVRMASVALDKDRCLSHQAERIRREQRRLVAMGRSPAEVEVEAGRPGICGECYMVCPLRGSAIRYEPGAFLTPVVDERRCAGCGLCEEICRVVLRGEPAIRIIPTRAAG